MQCVIADIHTFDSVRTLMEVRVLNKVKQGRISNKPLLKIT